MMTYTHLWRSVTNPDHDGEEVREGKLVAGL